MSILFPKIMLIEIKKRFDEIKNKYKYRFEISDIIKCKNDENLLEILGYYIYQIFENKQEHNLTKIKSYFRKQAKDKLFLFVFELIDNKIFKSEKPIEIFVKEFINDQVSRIKTIDYLREYAIGMKISELRDEVPGFVFTFLYLDEDYIHEILNKEYKDFYKIDDIYKNILMFMEKAGDYSLSKFLFSKPNEEDIINVYLQIILSLNAINQYYEFSHNDLHLNNIMITESEEPKILTYNVKLNGKQVKINLKVDKYLTKIIDFGLSSIKYQYDGEEVLSYNVNYKKDETYLYFPKEPFPENDIIKLTSSIYYLLGQFDEYSNYKYMFFDIINFTVKDINMFMANILQNNFYMYDYNWNNKTYDKILNYILYKCELSEYLNYSEKHKKEVECDSYLILDSDNIIRKNEDINVINLDLYIRNILNKYIKTGIIDYDKKEIYYRLPESFKYFLINKWIMDIDIINETLKTIIQKYKIGKKIPYRKDIKILYTFLNTSIYKIFLQIEEYDKISNFISNLIQYFEILETYPFDEMPKITEKKLLLNKISKYDQEEKLKDGFEHIGLI